MSKFIGIRFLSALCCLAVALPLVGGCGTFESESSGPQIRPNHRVGPADFAGAYRITTENAGAFLKWTGLNGHTAPGQRADDYSYSYTDFNNRFHKILPNQPQTFTLSWAGRDLQVSFLKAGRVFRSRVFKADQDFTIEGARIILGRRVQDNPYHIGPGGNIHSEKWLFLDARRNLAIRDKSSAFGLYLGVIPTSEKSDERALFERLP